MLPQSTGYVQDIPHVSSPRQRRFRRSVRLPGTCHRQDVRVQEIGKEEDQEEERRTDGVNREADFAKNQFQIRGKYQRTAPRSGSVSNGIDGLIVRVRICPNHRSC